MLVFFLSYVLASFIACYFPRLLDCLLCMPWNSKIGTNTRRTGTLSFQQKWQLLVSAFRLGADPLLPKLSEFQSSQASLLEGRVGHFSKRCSKEWMTYSRHGHPHMRKKS